MEIELSSIEDSPQMGYAWMSWDWTQFKLSWVQSLKFWTDWGGLPMFGFIFDTPNNKHIKRVKLGEKKKDSND